MAIHFFNTLNGKKNFTVRAKSAEKKKIFDFGENWCSGCFQGHLTQIWTQNLKIQNCGSKWKNLLDWHEN